MKEKKGEKNQCQIYGEKERKREKKKFDGHIINIDAPTHPKKR